MCRETVAEIGGWDWKGPPADSSDVVRRNNQLVRGGWSESQLRRHVSDSGEVGRQIHWSTVIHCSLGEYSDFEDDALWNTKLVKTGERVCYVFKTAKAEKIRRAAAFWTDWRCQIKLVGYKSHWRTVDSISKTVCFMLAISHDQTTQFLTRQINMHV